MKSEIENMEKFWFRIAFAILMFSLSAVTILRAQDGGFGGGGPVGDSIDVSGILGDRGGRGGGNFGNRGGSPLPDSKQMYSEIQSILKKGKTPLQKAQEKPLLNLLDQEVVNLSDQIQVLRNNSNDRGGPTGGFPGGGDLPPGGFPGGGDFPPGGFPGGGDFPRGGSDVPRGGNNGPGPSDNNNQINTLNVQIEALTSIKNDDFIDNKLSSFLSPEQVALVKKAKADDKTNATCLGGMLDHSANLQNNNGGGRGGRGGSNNFNPPFNNNNSKKTDGQPFCMTQEATASARLEPIRKVLAAGNLPLASDKESLAEIFMKSQIKDLEDGLRSSVTGAFPGNRGGFNRNNSQERIIQSSTDDMYKKVEMMLEPAQAETLKKWHLNQILSRGGVDSLITVEAMQDTPLSDDQIARVNVAFPEYRNQILSAAKSSKQNPSAKDLDNAATAKVLNLLDAKQIASYQAAKKLAAAK
jgi:hypothetical protein